MIEYYSRGKDFYPIQYYYLQRPMLCPPVSSIDRLQNCCSKSGFSEVWQDTNIIIVRFVTILHE